MNEFIVKHKASALIIKYLAGEMTAAEEKELQEWLTESSDHKQLFEELTSEEALRRQVKEVPVVRDRILAKINSELPQTKKIVPLFNGAAIRWLSAACLIGLVVLGWWFMVKDRNAVKVPATTIAETPDVSAPQSTKAMITLADGRKIALDSLTSGTLVMQNGVQVVKNATGEIVYQLTEAGTQSAEVYNTLFNPRGSKVVSLTLADGTQVWLNSESSLKYPVAFNGNGRKVQITGEAYFEVAKNRSKKFFVEADGVTTEVLGTHFNVNSYADDGTIKVTLLEGSVKVTAGSQQLKPGSLIIKPGQQVLANNQSLAVNNQPDLEEVMAWKNGKFDFGEKTDLNLILKQLARWYDVDIEMKAGMNKYFGGSISRTANLSDVLKVLETTSGVKFKMEGRRIIVNP